MPVHHRALQRRMALKQRDSGVEVAILLLSDTRHHRAWVRAAGPGLRQQFPTPARAALQALAAGRRPLENALILL